MKTKIIVASIAAALVITFISCGLFGSNEKKETAFNIEGEWTIDSIENNGSDSSADIGLLALALASRDSLPIGIEFKADSSFQYFNIADTTKGRYYVSDDQASLFIKEDTAYMQLNFIKKSDSAFVASTTDSIVYHLKRK